MQRCKSPVWWSETDSDIAKRVGEGSKAMPSLITAKGINYSTVGDQEFRMHIDPAEPILSGIEAN